MAFNLKGKFKKAKAKKWIQPVKKGYLMACCDCCLVHRLDFRVVKDRVQFRVDRAQGYTNKLRKKEGIKVTV